MDVEMSMRQAQPIILTALAMLLLASGGFAQVQPPTVPERVAALKATIADSQTRLKQYQWVETTVVLLKGEEKSRKQQQCYYGADGGLQKIEINASPEPDKKRGLRGRIIEKKKEELKDYMERAVTLVKNYVPPSPGKIQAVRDAGNVTIEMLEPGKRARLNFRNYLRVGDNLGIEVDLVSNRPLGLKVATYLDDMKDAVTLDAHMGQLNDDTSYASEITLNATAKNVKVVVQNSGYRKGGN